MQRDNGHYPKTKDEHQQDGLGRLSLDIAQGNSKYIHIVHLFHRVLKIFCTLEDISCPYHQVFTMLGPVERSRIAAAFNDIDPAGVELLAAVVADHVVSFLSVSLFRMKTDITGIKGGPDYAIITLDDKKLYRLSSIFILIMMS